MRQSKKAFGEVASSLIMFIAVIGITIAVVVSFQSFVVDSQSSLEDQQELTNNKLKTAIAISNTYYNDSSQKLYVYVKNIGDVQLETQVLDLYINEQFNNNFQTVSPINFSQNISTLPIQETLTVVVNKTLNPGTHKVQVVTQYGVGAEKSFNI